MGGSDGPIGLIAGRGALPVELLAAVRREGRRVVCVDIFDGDARLRDAADAYYTVGIGNLSGIVDALRRHGVRDVLLAGKVDKLRAVSEARLDADGAVVAGRMRDFRDTTILDAFVTALHGSGFRVADQSRYLRHLVPGHGVLTPRAPSAGEAADIEAGFRIASEIAGLDVGQAVALRHGTVVAVEAAEGTDDMIRRAGALASGIVVVKVSRPRQDPRYDLPVVGPETLRALARAGGTALAVEADRTLVVDRAGVVSAAEAAGIAVLAAPVPRAGPTRGG